MSQAVLAAASSSSSCSAAFKRHHSTRTPQLTTPRQLAPNQCQKTSFQGLSLGEAKKGVFDSLLVAAGNNRSGLGNYNVGKGRGLRVTARTTGASKSIEAEVDKPLGLTLGQKPGVNPNIFHHSCGWRWECSKGRAQGRGPSPLH